MENKTSKYFKYAIGEILLVVVGILIALQINNWNEKRVTLNHNTIILNNLISEFESNKTELKNSISRLSKVIDAFESVLTLTRLEHPNISQEDFEILLEKTFVTPSWTPSSFVLEEMKASGDLSNIENNNLKQVLFKWERDFSDMKSTEDGYDRYARDYIDFITINGSVRNLDALGGVIPHFKKSVLGKNELSLLTNLEFENRADNFYYLAFLLRQKYNGLLTSIDEIIKLAKEQIND